jgi:hypothetical protein
MGDKSLGCRLVLLVGGWQVYLPFDDESDANGATEGDNGEIFVERKGILGVCDWRRRG